MRALAAVFVLLLVSACQAPPPAEMTDAERAQIEAEAKQAIVGRFAGFRDALLNGDAEGWVSFWTPDARLLEPGMDMTGDDLFDFIREFFGSGGEVFAFETESYEIFVHGDVAYQIGQYDESFQFPGTEAVEVHNHFFMKWDRQPDGEWKIDRFLAGPRDAPPEG